MIRDYNGQEYETLGDALAMAYKTYRQHRKERFVLPRGYASEYYLKNLAAIQSSAEAARHTPNAGVTRAELFDKLTKIYWNTPGDTSEALEAIADYVFPLIADGAAGACITPEIDGVGEKTP